MSTNMKEFYAKCEVFEEKKRDIINGLLLLLPKSPPSYDVSADPGYWTNGEEILCSCEAEADIIADFLEDCGVDYVNTGYYDPDEDRRNNEQDDCTGFWYVSWE